MREIHEGICRNHAGGQSLAFKALRQGYYWSTRKTDCMEFAKKCDKCQRFAHVSKAHPEELTTTISPWLFIIWGIDLIGELPKGRGGAQYAVVAVDYFTKWVEEEALTSIKPTKIKEFVYRSIICRYGVPHPSYQTTTSSSIVANSKSSVIIYKSRGVFFSCATSSQWLGLGN